MMKNNALSSVPRTAHAGKRLRAPLTWLILMLVSAGPLAQAPGGRSGLAPIPFPELSTLEPSVQQALREAKEEFEKRAPELDGPALTDMYGQLGMLYHAHQLLDPAEVAYGNATGLTRGDFRWIHLRALALEDLGRLDEANAAFRRVLELNEKYVPAQLHIAGNLIATGRFDEAAREYDALHGKLPERAAVLAGLGRIAAHRGDDGKAVAYYEAALEAEPAASQIHYLLAIAYRKLGNRDKARFHAEQRGTQEPAIPDPLAAAMASLSRSSQYYLEVGYRAFRQGNHEMAIEAFTRAIEVDPTNATSHLSLGRALSLLGRLEEAHARFELSLELEPENPVANYRMATLLEHRGRDDAAIVYYKKAIAGNPDYFEARLLMANALMRRGKFEEAARAYAEASPPGSDPTLFLYREGVAYLGASRCDDAIGPLERALSLKPDSGEVMEALSRAYSTCPKTTNEQKKRALHIATRLYDALPDGERAQTMAMACAANGLAEEAIEYQTQSAFEALKAGTLQSQPGITQNLERYRAGKPAEKPWVAGHPVLSPRRLNLEDGSQELAPEKS